MTKQEIIQRLNAVCNTMAKDISVERGIQNYANYTGCFSVLQEILTALQNDDAEKKETEKTSKQFH